VVGVIVWWLLLSTNQVLAQSPAPTPMRGMDPRGGAAATMTGDPVLAAAAVVGLGILTAGVTSLFVLATRWWRDERPPRSDGERHP
jgi:hypothetical protein